MNKMHQLIRAINNSQAAGFVDALANPDFNGTVFAPTNAAFEAAIEDLDVTAEALLSEEYRGLLGKILAYHVSPEYLPSSALESGQSIPTLLKDAAPPTVDINDEGVFILSANVPAQVLTPDIVTTNGVVHIIDAVLLPPASDIAPGPASE